jgi:hypothetical protein
VWIVFQGKPDSKTMSPKKIRDVVEAEIDGDWSRADLHGVDLKARLLEVPTLHSYKNSWFDDKASETQANGRTLQLWLTEHPSGYSIVYDPEKNMFGLSVSDTFIGYYGSLDTFAAM